jgi:hypothetical protein
MDFRESKHSCCVYRLTRETSVVKPSPQKKLTVQWDQDLKFVNFWWSIRVETISDP